MSAHRSDCGVHNAPAHVNDRCTCQALNAPLKKCRCDRDARLVAHFHFLPTAKEHVMYRVECSSGFGSSECLHDGGGFDFELTALCYPAEYAVNNWNNLCEVQS